MSFGKKKIQVIFNSLYLTQLSKLHLLTLKINYLTNQGSEMDIKVVYGIVKCFLNVELTQLVPNFLFTH